MDKKLVAQELIKLAKGIVSEKKREVVKIDWNDEKSVKQGERKKTKLENAGYTLVKEDANLFRSTLVYELKGKEAAKSAKEVVGQYNIEDDLLRAITYRDLIDTVYSNEEVRDEKAVMKVFNELVEAAVHDARVDLKSNMKRILKEAEHE